MVIIKDIMIKDIHLIGNRVHPIVGTIMPKKTKGPNMHLNREIDPAERDTSNMQTSDWLVGLVQRMICLKT